MLPMLVMTGLVDNIFLNPERTDKKTGEVYAGRYKVQLRVHLPLSNGETKRDIVDLSTDHPDYFRLMLDKQVSLPVGAMPAGKDVRFYILKSWSPPSPASSTLGADFESKAA